MFEGFERHRIEADEVEINAVRGGSGPPVLLLHGYPQTHAMWDRVASILAEDFTVVAADLRGYGESSKPEGGADHARYSKRAMAADQVEVMGSFGFESFAVVGHDRGGRVGHRMALDHPERITELAVLDIVPTRHVFETVGKDLATAYYHWFFLIQPNGLPERLIGADPMYYLRWTLGRYGADTSIFTPEAMAEYERCFADPRTIHACCEDYRAAATIDLVHDEEDRNRKLTCPLFLLWGARGAIHELYDVEAVWREYAEEVRGKPLEAGHYLAEERPKEMARELAAFLSE